MRRPRFLSNKHTNCDFCRMDFVGNINTTNLFICDKCVRYLCAVSEEKKVKFLKHFAGEKDKERLIKLFINEEELENGGETQKHTKHPIGGNANSRFLRLRAAKVWKE
ncbi:MAG: hypothetical protein WAQ07_01025 [Candidatus Omnitrophota bacterium]